MYGTKYVCNDFAEKTDISCYDCQLSNVVPWATLLVFNGNNAVSCQLTSKADKLSSKTEPVGQDNNTS